MDEGARERAAYIRVTDWEHSDARRSATPRAHVKRHRERHIEDVAYLHNSIISWIRAVRVAQRSAGGSMVPQSLGLDFGRAAAKLRRFGGVPRHRHARGPLVGKAARGREGHARSCALGFQGGAPLEMDARAPANLVWPRREAGVHFRQGSRVYRPCVAKARDPAISVPAQRHDVGARDTPPRVHCEDEDVPTLKPRRNASGKFLGRRRHHAERFRAEERALQQLLQNCVGSPCCYPGGGVSQAFRGVPRIARRGAGLRRSRRISGGTSAQRRPNGNGAGRPRCGREPRLRRGGRGSPRARV